MQKEFKAGVINKELEEIKKIQDSEGSFLSMWTNTCSGYYTILCC